MTPADCTRSRFDFTRCDGCTGYGDCMWDSIGTPQEPTPYGDAPLKIIMPHCTTHRPHDWTAEVAR